VTYDLFLFPPTDCMHLGRLVSMGHLDDVSKAVGTAVCSDSALDMGTDM